MLHHLLGAIWEDPDIAAVASARDNAGMSPIHWACAHNRPEAVSLLAQAGANIEDADAEGKSALQWAVQSRAVQCAAEVLT